MPFQGTELSVPICAAGAGLCLSVKVSIHPSCLRQVKHTWMLTLPMEGSAYTQLVEFSSEVREKQNALMILWDPSIHPFTLPSTYPYIPLIYPPIHPPILSSPSIYLFNEYKLLSCGKHYSRHRESGSKQVRHRLTLVPHPE